MQQIEKLNKLIDNKLIEAEQWKAMAQKVTATNDGERVQCSGNQQKMAEAIHKYLAIQEEVDREIDALVEKKQEIIKVIEQLPVQEYDLLHMVYIQQIPLAEVAKRKNKDKRTLESLHGRALAKVQEIIDKHRKE